MSPVWQFSKMNAHGNDFVILDGLTQNITLNVKQRRHICDRHYGIGCDQILLLLPPKNTDSDFYCQIFNADGGEVGQCGNGMRCLGQFIYDQSLHHKKQWRIQTATTLISIQKTGTNIRATLGCPQFSAQSIPFEATSNKAPYPIEYLDQHGTIEVVSLGNGHAVMEVTDVQAVAVDAWGAALSTHKRFPQGVNVGFVYYKSINEIDLRIFERGVGETLACGSAAAAAVAVGHKLNKLSGLTQVNMPGGTLRVAWPAPDQGIWIEAPVSTAFEGRIRLTL